MHPIGTIFHQDWWLEAATGGAWGKAEVKRDNAIVGIWPYAIRRRHFTTRLDMPHYTRVLGPLLALPETKPAARTENACEVIEALSRAMPRHDLLNHCIAPEHDESMAFLLLGWKVEQGCTFRLSATAPQDAVLRDMKGRTRRDIKHCQARLAVETHHDLDHYIAMATKQVANQKNRRNEHRFEVLRRLYDASTLRDQSVMLTISDGNEAKAVAILLYDQHALYFWLGARKVEASNRAYTYLIWEAFRFAQSRGLAFDLDGFWTPNSGQYLASFGATPVHRPSVICRSNRFNALMLCRDILHTVKRHPHE